MANHKSAKKRARQTVKRTARNRPVKTHIKTTTRAFREAIAEGDKTKVEETYKAAAQTLRRAASRGVIPKRTASRRVSRLSVAFNTAR